MSMNLEKLREEIAALFERCAQYVADGETPIFESFADQVLSIPEIGDVVAKLRSLREATNAPSHSPNQ
jgi:hypothetical protein